MKKLNLIISIILSNYLDKLEGFPDITIFGGGHIPRIIEDGSIDNYTTYSYNLRKLYNELTTNFKIFLQFLRNITKRR